MSNWRAYKKTANNNFKSKINELNLGTSNKRISDFEEIFNVKLPKDFIDIYLENNGERKDLGYVVGLKFLSIEEIESTILDLKGVIKTYNHFSGKTIPENAIKKEYFNENWIPFITDSQGGYFGIDLSPEINGTNGQIINFGNDEPDHFVLAKDIDAFFDKVNRLVDGKGINDATIENFGHLSDLLKSEIDNSYFQ